MTSGFIGAHANAQTLTKFPQGDFESLRATATADIVEVISPQTVKLSNGQTVHLNGIQLIHDTQDSDGPFAFLALQILKDMYEGQTITLYQTQNKNLGRVNRMGHFLGHIVRARDGAWAQGTMIGLGLAAAKTSQRNPEMAKQLYALEQKARDEGLGIWAKDFKVLNPEDAHDHPNSFQIVEGKVLSAALKKNRIYLNFGQNWKDDFTVSIAPEDKRAFAKASINPLDYNGKTIRVRGWVEEYNGAYIEIDHPEAIEVLSR